jgi:hypothetical protein
MKINAANLGSFSLLSGTIRPAEAIKRLAGKEYGIIHKDHRELYGLVTVNDLWLAARRDAPSLLSRQARLPPTPIVGGKVELLTFIESGAATSFRLGAHGAVVIESGAVVGVLPVDIVDRYVRRRGLQYGPRIIAPAAYQAEIGGSSGGYVLGGGSDDDTTSFIAVKCTVCNWMNFLPVVPPDDEDLPQCANPNVPPPPHRLGVAR